MDWLDDRLVKSFPGRRTTCVWVSIFFFLSQEANKTSKVMLWCMKTTILSTCKIILKKNATSVQQGMEIFWEHLQQLPVVSSRPPCFVLASLHWVTFGCWLHVNWYSLFSSGVTVARLKIVGQMRHQANQQSDGCRKREASVKKRVWIDEARWGQRLTFGAVSCGGRRRICVQPDRKSQQQHLEFIRAGRSKLFLIRLPLNPQLHVGFSRPAKAPFRNLAPGCTFPFLHLSTIIPHLNILWRSKTHLHLDSG